MITQVDDSALSGALGDESGTSAATRAKRLIPPLVVFGIVTSIWYLISYGVMNANRRRVALPPPHEVLHKGFLTWKGTGRQGLKPILEAMLTTGRVALIGLLISTVLGILVAILMNQAKWVEQAIIPYAVLIQTIPILALVPTLKIWLGASLNARVLTCVLIAIFPVIINTLFGLQSTDRSHHELFTLHQAGRATRLWKLELPGRPAVDLHRPAHRRRRLRDRRRGRRLLLHPGFDRHRPVDQQLPEGPAHGGDVRGDPRRLVLRHPDLRRLQPAVEPCVAYVARIGADRGLTLPAN